MSKKSPITCHGIYALLSRSLSAYIQIFISFTVLDSSTGKPAQGVAVALQRHRKISEEGDVFSFDPIAHG